MMGLRIRVGVIFALFTFAAIMSAMGLYPTRYDRDVLKAEALPMVLDTWIGREVPVEDYVKQILETEDVIQRNYISRLSGPFPVQLAVVYSPDNRRVAHPPEVCYTGAGWETSEKREVRHEGLPPMIRLVLSHAGQKDLVLYCYKAGDQITASYARQQWNIITNMLLRRSTSSALIRFSTPIQVDASTAEARVVEFARLMMPEIETTLDY